MENITHEKVLESLNIIKQICTENKNCNSCPFQNFHDGIKCMINFYAPNKWEFEEKTIWKAFKEKD